GDVIEKDGSLVELESEKATMEVPATIGGKIRDVKVRVGDKVSQGDVLALVEVSGAASAPAPAPAVTPSLSTGSDTPTAPAPTPEPAPALAPAPAPAPVATSTNGH